MVTEIVARLEAVQRHQEELMFALRIELAGMIGVVEAMNDTPDNSYIKSLAAKIKNGVMTTPSYPPRDPE